MNKNRKKYILILILILILISVLIYIATRSNVVLINNSNINETIKTDRRKSESVEEYLYRKKYVVPSGELPVLDILYLKDNKYVNHQISIDDYLKIDVPKETQLYISLNQMNISEGLTWKVESDSKNINIVGNNKDISFFSLKKNDNRKFNRQLFRINTLNKQGENKIYFSLNSDEKRYCLVLDVK